ncbi:unnamed protein product [Choristocarpus tenellus]
MAAQDEDVPTSNKPGVIDAVQGSHFHVPTIGEAAEGADSGGNGEDLGLSEINSSLCMACGGQGTTRMLMTKIPFFREIILSSFECDECSWRNNEVVFGGELQEKGCRFELKVETAEDLNRQVIKSDYASVFFPSVEFEIPSKSQRGEITTVEGMLSTSVERLGQVQAERMEKTPEVGARVAQVIAALAGMGAGLSAYLPFVLIVDDPSGNSYVENPSAPNRDPALTVTHYLRSAKEDMLLGLQPSEDARDSGVIVDETKARATPKLMEGAMALAGLVRGEGGGEVAREVSVKHVEHCQSTSPWL